MMIGMAVVAAPVVAARGDEVAIHRRSPPIRRLRLVKAVGWSQAPRVVLTVVVECHGKGASGFYYDHRVRRARHTARLRLPVPAGRWVCRVDFWVDGHERAALHGRWWLR